MKNKILSIITSKLFIVIVLVILFKIITLYPELIEKYYSNGIYFYISNLLRMVFGIFGISIGDLLIFILIIYMIFKTYKYLKHQEKNFRKDIINFFESVLMIFLLFNIVWGFNYYRVPLDKKLNLETSYSKESLLLFTEKLILHTNKIHRKITKNNDSIVINHNLETNMYRNAVNDYKNIALDYPNFYFSNQSSKSSLWSIWLSITGFGGYYNPFTGEIQVNTLQPNYDMPALLCHEMAHQIGYASESEANFIAVLTTLKSDNLLTHYAGCSYLLKYCLNNIDPKDKEILKEKINLGILKNYQQDKLHQEKYSTFLAPIMKGIYNNFLILNNQEDGLDEYNHFLGMIISLNEKENILLKPKTKRKLKNK
ncbi:MAG: DUF3810 domain-containing protein [Flavobacterium sp.]